MPLKIAQFSKIFDSSLGKVYFYSDFFHFHIPTNKEKTNYFYFNEVI